MDPTVAVTAVGTADPRRLRAAAGPRRPVKVPHPVGAVSGRTLRMRRGSHSARTSQYCHRWRSRCGPLIREQCRDRDRPESVQVAASLGVVLRARHEPMRP